ncbi:MAG: regulatory protein RecX [Patescibacteria group bacterium]|nr:regulatory protein RecX [Patescibacteria group bacterium]
MNEKNNALKFAMKLISLRQRSVFEITERLKKKEYKNEIIKEVLDELKNYKYINDELFTESYINDRINFRPCGKFLIKKELKERGIEEDIINRKIEELINEEREIDSAKKLAKNKLQILSDKTDKKKTNQKICSYLQSRGFSFDIISKIVENEIEQR